MPAARLRESALTLLVVLAYAVDLPRAAAEPFPSRPITMIVPFAAGGSTDSIGRILADGMRASLGQTVIVENLGGASGALGVSKAVRAAADGYTICFGTWVSHVINPAVQPPPYDVLNDFQPISLVVTNPLVIVAKKTIVASDLAGLVAWLRLNPDKALLGTAGAGSASHFAGVVFERQTGTRMRHVPYRGLGFAMQDLVAGRVDMIMDLAANALPQVRAGTVKAYAVMAEHRLDIAADVPTIDEAGVPGLYVSVWQALWAPRGTPADAIARLDAAVVDALADPQVRRRMTDLGQEVFPRAQQTPEALRAFHRAEIDKWWPVIKAENAKSE